MTERKRIALVTGAARGIGAATVRALCAEGYGVLALDSCAGDAPERGAGVDYPLANRQDLEKLGAEHPGQVLVEVADVRDRAALDAAAARAVEHFGRLDAVVAAAAVITGGHPLWETPEAHLRTLWDVDVMGVWNTAAACVPYLLDGPAPSGCRFVAVASAAGTRGLFHLSGYGAAKHAVVGLVRGLAADLVNTGVTAVAVSPGSTRTAMLEATAALYGLDDVESFTDSQLRGRLNEPEEVAALIAFCCSPNGSVANGAVMSAEGGFRG
ncbi:mycofactocin-coupled SDR family oxidoreductase [Streptomyces sp. NBC_01352]|uniref:mycofactocin-coupled SDR family oxidoreductase n=1 Tax=Streptomyces sp. NBC_01352 TaxID=2903834 RepID=UPI002E2EA8D2|nr:mycofactocin-coupled SDR family oxidoreductase [Streptomyces sp. NBC_01352]